MSHPKPTSLPRGYVLGGFFAFGAASALGQILLLREFLVTFHGTEISVGAFYGAWFLWIAVGAWLTGRTRLRRLPDAPTYLGLHLSLPLAVLLEIVLLRTLRTALGVGPEDLLSMETLLASSAALTAPVGSIIGALFPVTGRLLAGAHRDPISVGYAFESAGSLAGGVAFTYGLATRFDPMVALAAMGILEGITVGSLALGARRRRAGALALGAVACYSLLLTPAGTRLDQATEALRWRSLQRGYRLVQVGHTPYSHVALGRAPGGTWGVFVDGIQQEQFPTPLAHEREAALALAQHPAARRILLLSSCATGLAQEMLRYPVARVDCVEDDPWALALVRAHLPPALRAALGDPRLRLHAQDGRLYVNRGAWGRRYDLVISRAAPPTTAAQNRYFTHEFFSRVRRILRPGGVFVLRLPETEDYLDPLTRRTAASVYHTLRAVFPKVVALVADANQLVAGDAGAGITSDPERLARRIAYLARTAASEPPTRTAAPASPTRAARLAEVLRGTLDPVRSRRLNRQLETTPSPSNSDASPITYFLALQRWGQRSGSRLVGFFEAAARGGVWLFAALILLLGAVRLAYRLVAPDPARSRRTNTALAIGVTGFAAMALQVLILLGFQSHEGSLYHKVGLLNGGFMVGLAAGALAGRWAAGRWLPPPLQLSGLLVLLGGLALATPEIMAATATHAAHWGSWVYVALSSAAGTVTGALFPLSVASYDPDDAHVGRTAAVMDAADHVGAAAGGLLAGSLLVPVAGQVHTARIVALAAAVPAALLAVDALLRRRGWLQRRRAPGTLSFPWLRFSWIAGALLLAVLLATAIVRARGSDLDAAPYRKPFPHWRYPTGPRPAAPEQATPGAAQPRPAQPRRAQPRRARSQADRLTAPSPSGPYGVGFETRWVAADIHGYAGPINLWVRFEPDGTLTRVLLRAHRETPSYVRGIPRWLERFEGHPYGRPFGGPKGVDALTGATVTCEAIQAILERARKRAARDLLHLAAAQGAGASPAPPPGWLIRAGRSPKTWAALGLLALLVLVHLSGSRRLRPLTLAASLITFGLWLNLPVTLVDVATAATGRLPGGIEKQALFAAVLLLGLALGPVWCSLGCPFGALQELLFLLTHPRALHAATNHGGARRFDPALEQRARYGKYLLLVWTLCFFLLTGSAAYLLVDPMPTLFSGRLTHLSALALALLALLLVTALLVFRPYCRYLCPVGAALALTNKLAWLDRLAPRRRIPQCDLGVTHPRDVDCLRCNRCVVRGAHPQDR